MRVLIINHFPLQGSGSGIYTLNIASQLVKQNHQVFVIDIDNRLDKNKYPFEWKTIICDKNKNEDPDLNFNFPCFTTHPRSSNTYYQLTDQEIENYVDVFTKKTKQIAERFQPDVIHSQHLWITPFAALQTGIPYVITAHGTDLMGFRKDKRYHKFALAGAKNASRIITISRQVHNDAMRLFSLPKDKFYLNPNGFDSSIFYPKNIDKDLVKEKFGLEKEAEKIVSFVGKFTDFKGIDILIKAARIVTDKIPKVTFAFAGDGELMGKMIKLRKELELENVHFLGHQNQENVASLYSAADVSVVPSRIEPFGLVAIEALACGTPVVATNAGGLPDFINEKVGKLVEMENYQKIAEAILEELQNNTKPSKGKFAAQYAKENYSWEKTLENVIKIYDETINEK